MTWPIVESHISAPALTNSQFDRIRHIAYQQFGLSLQTGKEALVHARLSKRLRKLGLASFDQYIDLVEKEKSGAELRAMIDALTTNQTSFFREPQHFQYLEAHVLPDLLAVRKPLRFWCAGCSSGEEPYSLAITLYERIPDLRGLDCRILATDISEQVLARARRGVYEVDRLRSMPAGCLGKYFHPAEDAKSPAFEVGNDLRSIVRFARLNLMESWPMKGPFDVIFCRNVMIYFDIPTRSELARRFTGMLGPGGHLFVGHSESLTQLSPDLAYVQPAVYRKRTGPMLPKGNP